MLAKNFNSEEVREFLKGKNLYKILKPDMIHCGFQYKEGLNEDIIKQLSAKKESLRRICIWKHYGESDGVGAEWWNYVSQFMERCDNPDYFAIILMNDILGGSGFSSRLVNRPGRARIMLAIHNVSPA